MECKDVNSGGVSHAIPAKPNTSKALCEIEYSDWVLQITFKSYVKGIHYFHRTSWQSQERL
jgi:hypothetical protein